MQKQKGDRCMNFHRRLRYFYWSTEKRINFPLVLAGAFHKDAHARVKLPIGNSVDSPRPSPRVSGFL